jgi:manganese/zinc/iron transport system substrate-binding protein
MTRKFQIIVILSIMTLLFSACSANSQANTAEDISSRQIKVVGTTGMICDAVENIGGERLSVTCLMGPGVDPHLYKASESDVRALEEADIIFYNGLHLEAGMSGVLERMEDYRTVVAISDAIDHSTLIAPPEFEGAYDPHIWFDVSLWMQIVDPIRDALVELDPGSSELYTNNAESYYTEMETLDVYVREQIESIPETQRVLITAHDAFNYFGRAYNFEVRGLQGISTQTEAGTGDVQDLVNFIVDRQIPAIFVESSVPQRNIEAVQEAVKAKGFEVNIGGELFSDAMGDTGTTEGTYFGMVRHNVDTIVGALNQ